MWRSNQTPDVASAEPSQVGTYRAYVFKYLRDHSGSATMTPVAPDELLPGSGFTLGLYAHGRIHISRQGPPDPEPGGMPPSPTWQATVTCIAKNNENLTDVRFVQLPFQAEVNGFGRKLVRPILWLNAMERVTLLYRFPSNQPGRTKRRAPDGSDLFANEAVEDDPVRYTNRNEWGRWFTEQAKTHLNQATVGLYYRVDNSTKLKPDGFWPLSSTSAAFVAGREQEDENQRTVTRASDEMRRLATHLPDSLSIHIFLVEKILGFTDAGETLLHGATMIDLGAQGGRYLLLADSGDPSTLAHELGHAIGNLDDLRDMHITQITGLLNNVRPIYGDMSPPASPENPLNWNLMRDALGKQRKDYNGKWLTESQTLRLWLRASDHPARKWPPE